MSSQPSITSLQVEIDLLKIQISKLQLEFSSARQKFTYRSVKSGDALVELNTGLPSAGDFDVLLQLTAESIDDPCSFGNQFLHQNCITSYTANCGKYLTILILITAQA